MQSLAEKRVYADRVEARSCYVASETGLVTVRVTGTGVGEFSLVDRRSAMDVATSRPNGDAETRPDSGHESAPRSATRRLAVATETDVLVGPIARTDATDDDVASASPTPDLEPTDFGPAVAVDVGPEWVLAASPAGDLARARIDADGHSIADDGWQPIAGPDELSVEAPTITAIEAPLVGTDHGVYRLVDGSLRPAGLDAVRALDTSVTPLVGTASGLYALGNGWMERFDGPVDALSVAHSNRSDESGQQVLASGTEMYVSSEAAASATEPDRAATVEEAARAEEEQLSWNRLVSADDPIVDLTHTDAHHVCAITDAGTVLAVGPNDTRERSIGVRNARAITN